MTLSKEKYTGICYDSRAVKPGSIFVCLRGEQTDGHKYIGSAVDAGATLIVVEKSALGADDLKQYEAKSVEFLEVEDTRLELAKLAAQFYGEPSRDLNLIGITGTNGKTTVSHLIQSTLSKKAACPILGTMGLKKTTESEYHDFGLTTPQSADLQKIFREVLDDNACSKPYLAMEVSSHALEQNRVGGIDYKAAVITNLSQDHLDYHMTMDKYFAAKAKIFNQVNEYAVLNADDDYYERFKKAALDKGLRIVSYGIKDPSEVKNLANDEAYFQAVDLSFEDAGLSFKLKINGELTCANTKEAQANETAFSLKLNGLFNVYNSLAAIALAVSEGIKISDVKDALEATPAVAGRFEVIKNDKSPFCIVDYAHSPDGLENILVGARALMKSGSREGGKLICLFGCGGDRDITKRPKMGKIAYDLADFVYVTSDNPRSEDPDQIIADILTGIPDLGRAKVIPDRATAIKESITNATAADLVVVAGKGHEDYQILPTGKIHFDDREEVTKAIEAFN